MRFKLAVCVAILVMAVLLAISPLRVPANASPNVVNVSIQGFAFSPSSVTINVGDTVTWTNLDFFPHTATSNTGVFDSGNLSNGQSFSFTFASAGTYNYHCSVHPGMQGQIVVQGGGPTSTFTPTRTRTPTVTPTSTPTLDLSTATPTQTPDLSTATPTPTDFVGTETTTPTPTQTFQKWKFYLPLLRH